MMLLEEKLRVKIFCNKYQTLDFEKICINKIPKIIKLIPTTSIAVIFCPKKAQLHSAISVIPSPDQVA